MSDSTSQTSWTNLARTSRRARIFGFFGACGVLAGCRMLGDGVRSRARRNRIWMGGASLLAGMLLLAAAAREQTSVRSLRASIAPQLAPPPNL